MQNIYATSCPTVRVPVCSSKARVWLHEDNDSAESLNRDAVDIRFLIARRFFWA